MSTVLETKDLSGGYGSIRILHGIDLAVEQGELLTIIGPNGCGKSTFLKAVFGLCTVTGGRVLLDGEEVTVERTDRLVARGLSYVPQLANVFPSLSVRENLQMGGLWLAAEALEGRIDRALGAFPDLIPRLSDPAASLSGGQRQMLAISRALISEPRLLLLDEPTAALSPRYQQQIIQHIDALRTDGTTIVLVEQNARLALQHADRCCVFAAGRLVHTAAASEVLDDPHIGELFLGVARDA